MLILSGTVTFTPADLETVRADALAMVAATREEEGCIEYEFAEVIGEPGVVRIFERWENREALNAHFQTPHMAAWQAATGGVQVVDRSLHTFEGDIDMQPL